MENKHISIQQPLLTLCISTDGSLEWVRSVLQSIEQHIEEGENRFEVVVTDNGNNAAFVEFMKAYVLEHQYVRYKKTNVQGFLNLCEAFRMAEGVFVKFINHRMPLKKGTLAYYIGFVKKHITQTSHTENIPYALKNQPKLDIKIHSRTPLPAQSAHPKGRQIVHETLQ